MTNMTLIAFSSIVHAKKSKYDITILIVVAHHFLSYKFMINILRCNHTSKCDILFENHSQT